MIKNPFTNYMHIALEEARAAADRGEVPVGAVLVYSPSGRVLARAGNRTEQDNDPTAHAEIIVIKAAALKLGSPRLVDCDMYVTLEPCAMCAVAISFARIKRLYYGASDPKSGGVEYGIRFFNQATCHHVPEVYDGLNASESSRILKSFFSMRRKSPPANRGSTTIKRTSLKG